MSGIHQMLVAGGSRFFVRLETHVVSDEIATPGTARATIRVDSDGVLYTRLGTGGYTPDANEWLIPADDAEADTYSVILETDTGTLSGGTADTWQALSSDREFYVEQAVVGSKEFTGTLRIRNASELVLASSGITLLATVSL